jgi:hypothetical protein
MKQHILPRQAAQIGGFASRPEGNDKFPTEKQKLTL